MRRRERGESDENTALPREVVHVADIEGMTCGDCGATICRSGHPPYLPYEHVVVYDGDPYASWRTTRDISCGGRGR